MKKRISIIGICIMTMLGFLLTGCGNSMPYSELDLAQYIEVGEYKGVEVKKVKTDVEKKDIGDYIVADLEAAAKDVEVSKGEAVKDGDTVNINYVGKIDGKKFDGGSAKNQNLVLGSGSFIEGFETGLIGHKVGEKGIELNLAFPLNYGKEELQGKDVVFTVKINSATRKEKPEYDDKFVQGLGGKYKTTEEYEKAVEDFLKKQKKSEAENTQKTEVWSKVLEGAEVKKYPEDIVEHYIEAFDSYIDYTAEQTNTDRETVMAQSFGVSTEKALKKQLKEVAELRVKQEMLIEYIAKAEGLSYGENALEDFQNGIESQGYDDERVERETGRSIEEYAHINLLFQKVQEFLLENASIK